MTTWQDPPRPTAGRPPKYMTPELVNLLRDHPGQWLLLDHHTKAAASSIRNWMVRHDGFEASQRTEGDHLDIYVRYVPSH